MLVFNHAMWENPTMVNVRQFRANPLAMPSTLMSRMERDAVPIIPTVK